VQYNGYYMHNVKSSLCGADKLFFDMGYTRAPNDQEILQLDIPPLVTFSASILLQFSIFLYFGPKNITLYPSPKIFIVTCGVLVCTIFDAFSHLLHFYISIGFYFSFIFTLPFSFILTLFSLLSGIQRYFPLPRSLCERARGGAFSSTHIHSCLNSITWTSYLSFICKYFRQFAGQIRLDLFLRLLGPGSGVFVRILC
jgi:hypothetical protein